MSLLARYMREAIVLDVEHWRRCPECNGSGEHHRPLRDPSGSVPSVSVVARIQCGTCKGKGKVLMYEEHREGTKSHFHKIYRP